MGRGTVVQEWLGHSTPGFTLAVSSHVLPGFQEEAAKILSVRLLGCDEQKLSAEGGVTFARVGILIGRVFFAGFARD